MGGGGDGGDGGGEIGGDGVDGGVGIGEDGWVGALGIFGQFTGSIGYDGHHGGGSQICLSVSSFTITFLMYLITWLKKGLLLCLLSKRTKQIPMFSCIGYTNMSNMVSGIGFSSGIEIQL